MRRLVPLLVLFALATPQTRPDFSGKWVLDGPPAAEGRAGAAAPDDAGSGWGSPLTIVQADGTLTVEYEFFARYDMQPPLKFTFALDGRETMNTVMLGRGFQEERSKTAWDGQALVITTTHMFTDPSTGKPATYDVVRRLSLPSPGTLVVEVERAGALGGPPSATRAVYNRAS